MHKVKAYFHPTQGVILVDRHGNVINHDSIQIAGTYIDASSKAGTTTMFTGTRATITFDVEVVNEDPRNLAQI